MSIPPFAESAVRAPGVEPTLLDLRLAGGRETDRIEDRALADTIGAEEHGARWELDAERVAIGEPADVKIQSHVGVQSRGFLSLGLISAAFIRRSAYAMNENVNAINAASGVLKAPCCNSR